MAVNEGCFKDCELFKLETELDQRGDSCPHSLCQDCINERKSEDNKCHICSLTILDHYSTKNDASAVVSSEPEIDLHLSGPFIFDVWMLIANGFPMRATIRLSLISRSWRTLAWILMKSFEATTLTGHVQYVLDSIRQVRVRSLPPPLSQVTSWTFRCRDTIDDQMLLKYLGGLQMLTYLDLSFTEVTGVTLSRLASYTKITRLVIENCVTFNELGVKKVAGMTQLRSLSLYCISLAQNACLHLTTLTNLTYFRLNGRHSATALLPLSRHLGGLRELALEDHIDLLPSAFVSVLANLTNLKVLSTDKSRFLPQYDFGNPTPSVLASESVEELTNTGFSASLDRAVEAFPNLRVLKFHQLTFWDHADDPCRLFLLTKLVDLELGHVAGINPDQRPNIVQFYSEWAMKLSRLTRLAVISNKNLEPEFFTELGKREHPRLRSLEFPGSSVPMHACKRFVSSFTSLTELIVSTNKVSDQFRHDLKELQVTLNHRRQEQLRLARDAEGIRWPKPAPAAVKKTKSKADLDRLRQQQLQQQKQERKYGNRKIKDQDDEPPAQESKGKGSTSGGKRKR